MTIIKYLTRRENPMEYIETEEYITVMPKGNVVNARQCHTLYKREGWTLENAKEFYGE